MRWNDHLIARANSNRFETNDDCVRTVGHPKGMFNTHKFGQIGVKISTLLLLNVGTTTANAHHDFCQCSLVTPKEIGIWEKRNCFHLGFEENLDVNKNSDETLSNKYKLKCQALYTN